MKINGKTQLGLGFAKHDMESLMQLHYEKYIAGSDPSTLMDSVAQLESIFSNRSNKNYMFRDTAVDLAKTIKIDKFEDFSFLSQLPLKKVTYLMGKDKFFRWSRWAEGGDIFCLVVKLEQVDKEHLEDVKNMQELFKMPDADIKKVILDRKEKGMISGLEADVLLTSIHQQDFRNVASKGMKYYVFGISTEDGKLNFPDSEKDGDFIDEMMLFMKMILFTELSDIETVMLNPGQSQGTKREGKNMNESNVPVIIVDSAWNKKTVTGAFGVRGHMRKARVGAGRSDIRYIYIEAFEKSGYTRTYKQKQL